VGLHLIRMNAWIFLQLAVLILFLSGSALILKVCNSRHDKQSSSWSPGLSAIVVLLLIIGSFYLYVPLPSLHGDGLTHQGRLDIITNTLAKDRELVDWCFSWYGGFYIETLYSAMMYPMLGVVGWLTGIPSAGLFASAAFIMSVCAFGFGFTRLRPHFGLFAAVLGSLSFYLSSERTGPYWGDGHPHVIFIVALLFACVASSFNQPQRDLVRGLHLGLASAIAVYLHAQYGAYAFCCLSLYFVVFAALEAMRGRRSSAVQIVCQLLIASGVVAVFVAPLIYRWITLSPYLIIHNGISGGVAHASLNRLLATILWSAHKKMWDVYYIGVIPLFSIAAVLFLIETCINA
jgi:hypothetical protein